MGRANNSYGLLLVLMAATIVCAYAGIAAAAEDDHPSWYSQFGGRLLTGSNAAYLDLGDQPGLFGGLSVSGFFNNSSGMWADSSALRSFGRSSGEHHTSNSLAVERSWIQIDTNYVLDGNNKFFLRFWGVYEPYYKWEDHSLLGTGTQYNRSEPDFYNRYDVRDAFWKNTTGALTTFFGRQIVTWGESLSFRVGDVINPQDLSWNFGFANLEQSRLPLWMFHPIANVPEFGAFGSNFIEGVWAPAWQPLYTSVDYPDSRYAGHYDVAGAVNLQPPGGGRFDSYPYPFTIPADTPRGRQAAFPQIAGPTVPRDTFQLPSDRLSNSMGGLRLHSVVEDAELTILYWHGHQLNNTTFVTGIPARGQAFQQRYPALDDLGVTLNRPIYFPGRFLEDIPVVVRTEGVWQDRTPFNTINVARPSAVIYSSTLNTLLALDLDNMAVPWLTRSGTLTANLEWNNYTILSFNHDMVYGGYAERWRHNEENVLFSVNTSWWWGAIAPTVSTIYNPDGNTWEFFPNVVFTPPWTNKYLLTLEYVGVLSNDKYGAYAGGNFSSKDILLMQFQYNFDLVRGRR